MRRCKPSFLYVIGFVSLIQNRSIISKKSTDSDIGAGAAYTSALVLLGISGCAALFHMLTAKSQARTNSSFDNSLCLFARIKSMFGTLSLDLDFTDCLSENQNVLITCSWSRLKICSAGLDFILGAVGLWTPPCLAIIPLYNSCILLDL